MLTTANRNDVLVTRRTFTIRFIFTGGSGGCWWFWWLLMVLVVTDGSGGC